MRRSLPRLVDQRNEQVHHETIVIGYTDRAGTVGRLGSIAFGLYRHIEVGLAVLHAQDAQPDWRPGNAWSSICKIGTVRP